MKLVLTLVLISLSIISWAQGQEREKKNNDIKNAQQQINVVLKKEQLIVQQQNILQKQSDSIYIHKKGKLMNENEYKAYNKNVYKINALNDSLNILQNELRITVERLHWKELNK